MKTQVIEPVCIEQNETYSNTLTPFLTEEQACQFLTISRSAILKFKRNAIDPIPCFKAGRRYLYDHKEIKKWALRQANRALKKYHKP